MDIGKISAKVLKIETIKIADPYQSFFFSIHRSSYLSLFLPHKRSHTYIIVCGVFNFDKILKRNQQQFISKWNILNLWYYECILLKLFSNHILFHKIHFGSSCGVVANEFYCKIVVSEFELQPFYGVQFRTNMLGKGMNLLIPTATD